MIIWLSRVFTTFVLLTCCVAIDYPDVCASTGHSYHTAADAHISTVLSAPIPPGVTRSRTSDKYALLAPDSRVYADLPAGWHGAGSAAAVVTPAIGAHFVMFLIRLEMDARIDCPTTFEDAPEGLERFFYVLDGAVDVHAAESDQHRQLLKPGGFVYVGPGETYIKSLVARKDTSMIQIDRIYALTRSHQHPKKTSIVGSESDIKSVIPPGEQFQLRRLLDPANPGYDFNIHIMDFHPGQFLGVKEMHYNQHGLLMLEGQGIYLLDGDFMPVQAGDVIWMAPFCPQWYAALGENGTRYFLYKDTQRNQLIV